MTLYRSWLRKALLLSNFSNSTETAADTVERHNQEIRAGSPLDKCHKALKYTRNLNFRLL